MEKLIEFLSRFPEGDYNLETFEEIEEGNENFDYCYPYFSIVNNTIHLFIVDRGGIFIKIDPYQKCGDRGAVVHIVMGDSGDETCISSCHTNIEIGMELYLANSEKPVEQILRDIAISVKPYLEFIQNAEFIVKPGKSAK